MSLTDILKNTAYALTTSLALASPLYSAEQPRPFPDAIPSYSQKEQQFPNLPKEMSDEEKKDTRKYFELLKPEEKVKFKEIFSDPKEYLKRAFKKEEQRDFEAYFNMGLEKMSKEERSYLEGILNDALKKRFPWKSDSKTVYNPKATDSYTLSRRLWQYYEDKKFEEIVIDPKK
ncbi:Uncharacterised protein [uncultured archaeon]|nr:Uncharacterised protein [uncultured archaeon]